MIERAYSYKPQPKFFGEGSVYLGVELEVEAPDYAKKQEGLGIQRSPEWAYAKRDGSLSATGWEMVTHPISMKLWLTRDEVRDYHNILPGTVLTARYKGAVYTATVRDGGRVEWNGTIYSSISAAGKAIRGGKSTNGYQFFGLVNDRNRTPNPSMAFFQLVASLKALGYTSHDNTRCGFHIHVSRTAFSDLGHLHTPMFYRFRCLINGALFRKLSQRTNFSYCQQAPVTVHDFAESNGSRYYAVNITRKTVEIRIFRGNLREDRLRKAMEAVIAAIEFSRETARELGMTQPDDSEYVDYIRRHADRFPNLVQYVNTLLSVEGQQAPTDEGV